MAVIVQKYSGELLRGTSGNDTFYVNFPSFTIQDFLPSTDVIISNVHLDVNWGQIESTIEAVSLAGDNNLTLKGDDGYGMSLAGNSGNNTILSAGFTASGTNFLGGPSLSGNTMWGGAGDDSLAVTHPHLVPDILDGGPGADTMRGGLGDDTYYVDNPGDRIIDSGGTDTVFYAPSMVVGGALDVVKSNSSGVDTWSPTHEIDVSVRNISGFFTVVGVPSEAEYFEMTARGLGSPVTLTCHGGFEISKSFTSEYAPSTGWANSVTVPINSGSGSGGATYGENFFWVRISSNTPTANRRDGSVTISSTLPSGGEVTETVVLTGWVNGQNSANNRIFIRQAQGYNSTIFEASNISANCADFPKTSLITYGARAALFKGSVPHTRITGSSPKKISFSYFNLGTTVLVEPGYYSIYPELLVYGSSCSQSTPSSAYGELLFNQLNWACVITQPPVIQGGQNVSAVKGVELTYLVQMVAASTSRIPQLVYAKGLPPGLSLRLDNNPNPVLHGLTNTGDPQTYLPVISGTPTSAGQYQAIVTAKNSYGTDTSTIEFNVSGTTDDTYVPPDTVTGGICGEFVCAGAVPNQSFEGAVNTFFYKKLQTLGKVTSLELVPKIDGRPYEGPPSWLYVERPNEANGYTWGYIKGTPGQNQTEDGRRVDVWIGGPNNWSTESFYLTISAQASPKINTSGSFTGFDSTVGVSSVAQSIAVSGFNLSGAVTFSCTGPFEVSPDNTTFTQNFIKSKGEYNTISIPNLYVRMSRNAGLGQQTGTLNISTENFSTLTLALTGTTTPSSSTRPVIFSVNMNVKAAFGGFNASTDIVKVMGEFNNWTGDLVSDPDADGVYSATIYVEGEPGSEVKFKFYIQSQDLWESLPSGLDRTLLLGPSDQLQVTATVNWNDSDDLPGLLVGVTYPKAVYVGSVPVSRVHLGEAQLFAA